MKLLIFLLITTNIWANSPFSISFGQVQIGEKRLKINLNNFKLISSSKSEYIKSKILRGSTQWVRTEGNLLTPRALVSISVKTNKSISIRHHNKNIIAQGTKVKNAKLYVNLFHPEDFLIYEDDKLLDTLRLRSNVVLDQKKGHLIDYSCSRYNLEIKGLDDQYLSIGCQIDKLGKIGKERNRLTLNWSTSNFKLLSKQNAPFTSILMSPHPIQFKMIDDQNNVREVSIKANFKSRFNRLKTAIGFGPYMFESKQGDLYRDSSLAPAAMLYGRWDLSPGASLRFFDALVYKTSIFNNSGIYFAYDLASAMDHRIKIVPLIGLQGLTYKYDSKNNSSHKIIYPQGFEIEFHHLFGIENYNANYGMFLSTQSDEVYSNIWLRWGKGYFWELNYIKWGRGTQEAKMYGLSIGIPTGAYF